MMDTYNLQRFVEAQRPVFDQALHELQDGQKRTHWMWFIFPQIQGLGRTETARHFAISGAGEALAYLQHSTLGPRLLQATEAVARFQGRPISQILAPPDDLKLRSCMTLFANVADDPLPFNQVLDAFFDGQPDAKTLDALGL
ncbi:DUF1810 domain-containing protein [Pseudomonas sp. M47T1]|uniref:DUF1810 domain-containing protein n=2 Tax=unclassified Pseudomonas TaxID=196821 RepID=UPI0005B77C83|nr:DUF1810 domain-containing protein [Pseudomonas sp. M47T1]